MASPLIARLTTVHGIAAVGSAELDAFLAQAGERVLFLTDDPTSNRETNDVAVVLPELMAAMGGRLSAAVADRALEPQLTLRFAVLVLPALLFFRDGLFLGQITRMRDWDLYLRMAADLLGKPGEPVLPDVSAGGA